MVRGSGLASLIRRAVLGLSVLSFVVVPPLAPSARGAAQTGRVEQALVAMERARTLPELSRALGEAKLTDAELKQLGDLVQKRPLYKTMETLKKQALASSTLSQAKKGPSAEQLLEGSRRALQKAQADFLTKSRQAVLKLNPAKSANTPVVKSTTSGPFATLSAAKVASLASTPGGGSNARITYCSALVVGEQATVRGTGFGNAEGRVALIIGRDLYYLPVNSWTSNRITCTVTDELGAAVEGWADGKDALLWVKLHGGETGPTRKTVVEPNPESIAPLIESITPAEISPGQTFIIRGRNLANYRFDRVIVELLFGRDSWVRAVIEDAEHDFIQAKIPDDLHGMERTVCRLQVTNDLGRRTDEGTVTFVPAEEILSIRTPGSLLAASQPAFPIFLSIIGDTTRVTVHDIVLQNGWVVEDCVLDVTTEGINSGAYYVEKPARGSTLARAVIEVWADAYSRAVAVETLIIRGPRGVPYR